MRRPPWEKTVRILLCTVRSVLEQLNYLEYLIPVSGYFQQHFAYGCWKVARFAYWCKQRGSVKMTNNITSPCLILLYFLLCVIALRLKTIAIISGSTENGQRKHILCFHRFFHRLCVLFIGVDFLYCKIKSSGILFVPPVYIYHVIS